MSKRVVVTVVASTVLLGVVVAEDLDLRSLSDCALRERLSDMSDRFDSRKVQKQLAIATEAEGREFERLYRESVFREKLVYGVDDRSDLYAVNIEKVQANANATAALVRKAYIEGGEAPGTWILRAPTFAQQYNVCSGNPDRPDERFATQPTAAFCTGFLVAPDRLVTAGHCVRGGDAELPQFKVVFGYRMATAVAARTTYEADDVYTPVQLLDRREDEAGEDWAVLRLDRSVSGRTPVRMRRTDRIPDGTGVYVIGCPLGLPLKYAAGAVVRDNRPVPFFVANLDTYGGNSGSPVFSATEHHVEGILVRGETDFETSPRGCVQSKVCPDTECRGEDVTRIRVVPAEYLRRGDGR